MKKIDMSSEAISRRLRQTDQLRELSLSLIRPAQSYSVPAGQVRHPSLEQ